MLFGVRSVSDVAILLLALGLQSFVLGRILAAERQRQVAARLALALSSVFLCAGLLFDPVQLPQLPSFLAAFAGQVRGWALAWALTIIGSAIVARFLPKPAEFSSARRLLLQRTAVAAPLAVAGFAAIVERSRIQVTEIDVGIPGLPADLDGLRIVQLTDIHLGPFFDRSELARAVDMANELRPNLSVVTGDLITRYGDPLDDALREISRLRAEAGIFGCHGNHEIYAGAESYITGRSARFGAEYLRNRVARLRFGTARLNLAGVDYQRMKGPYLHGMERFANPGNVNILLSHNPDVFPVAARQGYALTLSGHTHGGQVNFEILHRDLNIATFVTPYTKGLYQEGGSAVYVSRGLGTVGIPIRIGAPPEVTLVRLCAT